MFEISLTHEEAAALTAILANVGGSPADSPRKHLVVIAALLAHEGYVFYDGLAGDYSELIADGPGITFKNFSEPFEPGFYQHNTDEQKIRYWTTRPHERYWTRVNVTIAE